MTVLDQALVSEVIGAIEEVQGDAALMTAVYRHQLTWSDGTTCWCSVKPSKSPASVAQATAWAQQAGVPFESVRWLKVRPGEPTPGENAECSFDGGTLTLHLWGQVSQWSGQAVGTCTLRR